MNRKMYERNNSQSGDLKKPGYGLLYGDYGLGGNA